MRRQLIRDSQLQMKATNVTKIQIKLFVEESQQLETSI